MDKLAFKTEGVLVYETNYTHGCFFLMYSFTPVSNLEAIMCLETTNMNKSYNEAKFPVAPGLSSTRLLKHEVFFSFSTLTIYVNV